MQMGRQRQEMFKEIMYSTPNQCPQQGRTKKSIFMIEHKPPVSQMSDGGFRLYHFLSLGEGGGVHEEAGPGGDRDLAIAERREGEGRMAIAAKRGADGQRRAPPLSLPPPQPWLMEAEGI